MEKVVSQERTQETQRGGARRRWFLLHYLRPQNGTALVLWRVEAYTATPLALLLIATLGRWPAALAMGAVMAVFAAIFLILLDGDPALRDVRAQAGRYRVGRALERLATRDDGAGRLRRALSVVPAVMLLGPFWRAVAFHLFRMRRSMAHVLSVGGSIPHALLWTGLILGGLWGSLFAPVLNALWSDVFSSAITWFGEALILTPLGGL